MKDFSPLAITAAAVGCPARLCVITRTDGTIYRIAESDIAITVGADTFAVVAGTLISAVKHTANGEMPSCQIVAVHGNAAIFNSVDLDLGLFDGATVQLFIVDRANLSAKGLLFTGAMSTITMDPCGRQVVFDVKGATSFSKILMTQKRSPMCRTDLFSSLCGLTAATYAVTATVASIVSAFTFTVSGLSIATPADGYFNQGELVTAGGTAFEIAGWVQSTLTITSYAPRDRFLSVGMAVTLYPGCDKTMGVNGCPKFNNQLNFQAEPHFLGTAAAAQQV